MLCQAQYTASLPSKWGQINVDITYPATEKHIRKACKQEYFMVCVYPISIICDLKFS